MEGPTPRLGLTERRDLRGGRTSWRAEDIPSVQSDPLPEGRVEVAIIGAGIMGAAVAERLSAQGRRVAVLDRRPPAHGSTAASTALVMWGIDVPLSHLSLTLGFDEAAHRWKRVFLAVDDLATRIDAQGLDCDRIERPELYLAGTLLDEAGLREEVALRIRAGLPSVFIEAPEVAARFGIAPRAALLSRGAWEVNPVKLTTALLERARSSGCTVSWPVDVLGLESGKRPRLLLDDGRSLEAACIVIAGGYERAPLFLPTDFSLKSSYAIATPRNTPPLWRERAMIWEASSTYTYARSTADGRIIAGGEDEDLTDPDKRDRLLPEKRDALAKKLAALTRMADVPVDCVWSATFGSSPDGLPAIGPAANYDGVWLASGFGGNGISFAALGAEIIASDLAGRAEPSAGYFDPYRFKTRARSA